MPAIINTVRPYKNGKTPKVKTLVELNFKQVLADKMSERFHDIVDAQIEAATGFQKEILTKKGDIISVRDNPDTQAAKLLFDYTLEKPEQKVKLGGMVGIVQLVAQLEHGDTEQEN